MPHFDYVVLADYVRQDAGVVSIMAAGIDTFQVHPPVAVPVGVAARITFDSTEEVGTEHLLELVFQGDDGPLLQTRNHFATPPKPAGVPAHWRTGIGIALRLALPFPRHGDYSLELAIDGDERLAKSIDVRAVAPGSLRAP